MPRLVLVQPPPYFYALLPSNLVGLAAWVSGHRPEWELDYHAVELWKDDDLALYDLAKWVHPWMQGELIHYIHYGSERDTTEGRSFRSWLETALHAVMARAPDVVAMPTAVNSWMYALPLAAALRHLERPPVVVLGGPHITLLLQIATKFGNRALAAELCRSADFLVPGEGEHGLCEILDHVSRARGVSTSWQTTNGELRPPAALAPVIRLGSYPAPDYRLFEASLRRDITPWVPIEISRGCQGDCSFCCVNEYWGRKLRLKPIENILRELAVFEEQLGEAAVLHFVDVTVNPSWPNARVLFEHLAARGGIPWVSFARIADMNDGVLDLLARSGAKQLLYGVESASDEQLKAVHKAHSVEDSLRIIEKTVAVGIEPVPSVIVGLPGETEESVGRTIAFARRLHAMGASMIVEEFLPHPLSPLVMNGEVNYKAMVKTEPSEDSMPMGPHFWFSPPKPPWREEMLSRAREFATCADFFLKH